MKQFEHPCKMPVTDHHENPEPLFERGCGAECALCPDEFQDGHSNHDFTAMNIPLLLKVKEAILANPDHFDMESYFFPNHCGTSACIGGWAIAIAHFDSSPDKAFQSMDTWESPRKVAQRALELTDHQAETLFHEYSLLTSEDAAVYIDEFIASNA